MTGGERVAHATLRVIGIDSRTCRKLNREFLGHDYVTDVLAFSLGEGMRFEGEIYINLDRAQQQAAEYGVSPTHERARLVIHGVLHLIGYDDRTTRQSKRMRAREDHYLQRLITRHGGTVRP